jgi:hypothetical protein
VQETSNMPPKITPFAAVAALLLAALPAAATESNSALRCGWFENPTPGNAWLTDRHGQWLVGLQGGHQAEGDWPQFPETEWVSTNGSYGYGCACLRVVADAQALTIQRILSAKPRSLQACRDDRALTEPGS